MNCLCVIANFEKYKIRKMRDAIPSVPGLLEQLRKNPNNTALGECVIMHIPSSYYFDAYSMSYRVHTQALCV